ncbi:MAG: transglycosylase SLT domain-containing protein [Deltaproteobacteria bacterium]|jgi:hypothetical protein|nr:transglycosylase SLT domain-containing protein [Deltaproteobacteria bacterium]
MTKPAQLLPKPRREGPGKGFPATPAALVPALALALAASFACARPALAAGYFGSGLSFASEPVPLSQPEIYETLDQELILVSEAKARVFLALRRAPRTLPLVESALRASGVPEDFKYLPMAMTSLDPLFRNGGRRGIWRLTESEAGGMGLSVNRLVDQRLDPAASSEASARRLASLHQSWGTWTAALAAFLDQGAMSSAASESGGERDYYKLFVSPELDKAVCQVLAGKVLFSDPSVYGYRPSRAWPKLSGSRSASEGGNMRELARRHGTDYKTFRDMNPHILTDSVPSGTVLNVP